MSRSFSLSQENDAFHKRVGVTIVKLSLFMLPTFITLKDGHFLHNFKSQVTREALIFTDSLRPPGHFYFIITKGIESTKRIIIHADKLRINFYEKFSSAFVLLFI